MSVSSISNSQISKIFNEQSFSGIVGRSKGDDSLIAKSDTHVGLARVKSFFSPTARNENREIKKDFVNALAKEFGLSAVDKKMLQNALKVDKGTPLTMQKAQLFINAAKDMQQKNEDFELGLTFKDPTPEFQPKSIDLSASMPQRGVDPQIGMSSDKKAPFELAHNFSDAGVTNIRDSEDIFSAIGHDLAEQEKTPKLPPETMSKQNASINDVETMSHQHDSISSTMSEVLNKLDSENGKHDLSSRVGQYGDEDLLKTAVSREKVVKNEIKPTNVDSGMSILQELGMDKIAHPEKN